MRRLIAQTRYVSLLAVVALLVTSFVTFGWGVVKAARLWAVMATGGGSKGEVTVGLIQTIDGFLIAITLYVFAVSVYELFIGRLDLPDWMVAHDLTELKTKLGNVIVLVMAVRFLEELFESTRPPLEVLWLGLATAAIAMVLVLSNVLTTRERGGNDAG